MKYLIIMSPILAITLSACESEAEQKADVIEDRIEQQADASAIAAGNELAALGLTEAQLLDADLVSSDGTDLGDVEQVRRDAAGAVEGLLVSIENSNPDRYVLVPITDLQTRPDANDINDINVQTPMTAQQLLDMPETQLTGV